MFHRTEKPVALTIRYDTIRYDREFI